MKHKLGMLFAGVVALGLVGCGKLNQENYDKLDVGMTLAEIETVIGGHDTCSSTLGTQTCLWGNKEGKHIEVRFVADAAIAFSSNDL